MISALKWIWEQICHLGSLIAGLASNIWTWIVAGFSWLASEIIGWVGGLIDFPTIEWPELVPFDSGLFRAVVYIFALDKAVLSLGVCLTAWIAARVARLAMVPIRALLELF